MRMNYWILGLITLTAVIGLFVTRDPEQADRLAQARRGAALTGETRELVIMLLALGIGGFVAYLAMTRR